MKKGVLPFIHSGFLLKYDELRRDLDHRRSRRLRLPDLGLAQDIFVKIMEEVN